MNYLRTYGSGSSFSVEIDCPNNKKADYFLECCSVADKIPTNEKIYLMYSGGVDSEYIANILLHRRIKFIPVIVKLLPNYNDHDIQYALNFCKLNNLVPKIIDIDFDKFISSTKFLANFSSFLTVYI